ncbi:hypothetical protein KIPB_016030, partial [Kipferlia bialata]
IIGMVAALPVVSEERRNHIARALGKTTVDLEWCPDSGNERDTILAQRDALFTEQQQLEDTLAEWYRLSKLLTRHKDHPDAAEVLSSRSLDHPLDGSCLDIFTHLCLTIPLHRFNPTAFDSVGRSSLMHGVHPGSGLPVVLKPYSLTDKVEMEAALREVSVLASVQDVHIVRFLGLVVEGKSCYIVTEKYDCNLMDFLDTNPSVETRR